MAFRPPIEAPVFTPTREEFEDSLNYIKSIRPRAERWGICKIKPPPGWLPPFALDVDNFVFSTRIQTLNELEANTRIKLLFFDKIANFWELQGLTLHIPMVERKILDMYTLHALVRSEGGVDAVNRSKKWPCIARRMGFFNAKAAGPQLKCHYDRLLGPYDIFIEEKSPIGGSRTGPIESNTLFNVQSVNRSATGRNCSHEKKCGCGESMQDSGGPTIHRKADEHNYSTPLFENRENIDPMDKCMCQICGKDNEDELVLLCDGCDDAYHTFCLQPPLSGVPPGNWRCPRCVAVEVSKPAEAYGFEQATRKYTLVQFGEMAETFKAEYFNMDGPQVPLSTVEQEFWRVVSTVDENVRVEYGADLHVKDHGSAFPTSKCIGLNSVDQEYVKSKWNLNNIPIQKGSVLRYINSEVSGMKIPWMYVGMCFSSFCWHNEDHWNYSINYLHWGEAKTWYGVPGDEAELFEECMRNAVPELFKSHPDVLHHLVTMMNPNILMDAGVSVCRTDQQPGEFVITFPRAYHAGFNQGYNFAEAVNFALPDWLKAGRKCVNIYSVERRHCVFSHDELVCNIALHAADLTPELASETCADMSAMIEEEAEMRAAVKKGGICKQEQENFELLVDDARQCDICKTTCFLSAVSCECNPSRLACLHHCERLCNCSRDRYTLRFRYTLLELKELLNKLLDRCQTFNSWAKQVRRAMVVTSFNKGEHTKFKKFLEIGKHCNLCETDEYKGLRNAVKCGDKCNSIVREICWNRDKLCKLHNSCQEESMKGYINVTVEELRALKDKIQNLPFIIEAGDILSDLLRRITHFKTTSDGLLKSEEPNLKDMESCIEEGEHIEIYLPELSQLKKYYEIMCWLDDVRRLQQHYEKLTVDVLQKLLDDGLKLPAHPKVEKSLSELQNLSTQVERWENKVSRRLQEKPLMMLADIEDMLKEAEGLHARLPSVDILRGILKRIMNWTAEVETLGLRDNNPYDSTLETLVKRGRDIPAFLPQLPKLELRLSDAQAWRMKASRIFLRKNSHFTLMDVLAPRIKFGRVILKKCIRNSRRRGTLPPRAQDVPVVGQTRLEGNLGISDMDASFSRAERYEEETMTILRLRNKEKRHGHKKDTKYCICRRPMFGVMLECQLCYDLFHKVCVPCKKSMNSKDMREVKYLCPCCLRSRRPRLETILALIVDAEVIRVRTPEGDALQCLSIRATAWQENARKLLGMPEVASALAKLSVLSQKKIEAEAREKTQKIITSQLRKVAGNTERGAPGQNITAMVATSSDTSVLHVAESVCQYGATQSDRSTHFGNESHGANRLIHAMTDHRYQSEITSTKPPEAVQTIESPVVTLSQSTKAQLIRLMMLGDLLEISLDESHHIWRVLQASKSPNESLITFNTAENETPIVIENFPIRRKIPVSRGDDHPDKSSSVHGKKKGVKQPRVERRDGDQGDSGAEDCSAPRCLKPRDDAIHWVQCDGPCKRWFHLRCMGLRRKDVKTHVDFYCDPCLDAFMTGNA